MKTAIVIALATWLAAFSDVVSGSTVQTVQKVSYDLKAQRAKDREWSFTSTLFEHPIDLPFPLFSPPDLCKTSLLRVSRIRRLLKEPSLGSGACGQIEHTLSSPIRRLTRRCHLHGVYPRHISSPSFIYYCSFCSTC